MNVPLGEVIFFDVITSNPSTGAVSDADSTPSFEVFEESTDTDIGVGGNLTKRTSKTGDYRGTFTASTGNGFEAGKWYNVVASATVNSVAGKAVAMRFRAVVAETVVGEPVVDIGHVAGTAASTYDGTASAGGTATITLQSGQSYGTNVLRGRRITITGGTGAGQSEIIASNTNASPSVVTIARNWGTQPSTDSTYVVGDAAGVDWGNVNAPTATVVLSGTTVGTLTTYTGNTPQTGDAYGRIGAAGVGLTNIVLPSGGLANVTAWTVAITGNVTGNLSGSVGSVTGAVGSVTGNVGGTVATVTTLTNLPAAPTDWLTAAAVKADAVTKIQAGLSTFNGDLSALATATNLAAVKTDTAAIKLKTDLIPAAPAAVGDVPTAAQNAAALLDLSNGVETGLTPRGALRIMSAALAGKLSGAATTTVTIRNTADSKSRIVATCDSDGNRSAVTLDAS